MIGRRKISPYDAFRIFLALICKLSKLMTDLIMT